MQEVASLKIRISPEALEAIAAQLGCTVTWGDPDADGFVEPVFTQKREAH